MEIRQYDIKDNKQIRNIHFETGFLGNSMSELLTRRKEWNNRINYYLEKEPESIFVAEENGKIQGYILGCLDDINYNQKKEFIGNILSNFLKLPFLPKHDRRFWLSQIKAAFMAYTGKSDERKLNIPEKSGHVHINLLPGSRKKGVGSLLLKEYIKYAKSKGIKSIHAEAYKTDIHNNSAFWLKNGFKEYSSVNTKIWEYQYPKKQVSLICYFLQLE